MTSSGHIATSAIIFHFTGDPYTVVAANLVAHPIVDAIPHAEWSTFKSSKTKMVVVTALDIAVSVGLMMIIFAKFGWQLALLAIIAGMWIDVIDFLTLVRWKKFRFLHELFHTWPRSAVAPINWQETLTGRTPTWIKFAVQIVMVATGFYLILK
ncbi:MAG: hypothetical protein Athens101428_395 [Candidatus Berkelbacteria bacterium Athens1014_28]|uniref:Uncharacterized protein n=1 Tax=Candidatus Berkelbacteria bacterium Athens1014_28 TaxID=2017145 RepID=A0A554LN01_9BACT|nr:MAG: hypothetical protein Athens101428_395 [Candidatus Berkelbacteria bacterium Athens1014_28]